MEQSKLNEILDKLAKWLNNDPGGIRADLSYAELREVNLIMFQFNQDVAYFQFDGMIRIGCEYHSIDEWIENAENIGMKHNYTEVEIKEYKHFIKRCKKLQRGTK